MSYEQMIKEAGLKESDIRRMVQSTADQRSSYGPWKVKASSINGLGVFTIRDMDDNEAIGWARLQGKRTPLGRYLNHSDTPNAKMLNHNGHLRVYLLGPLKANREITVDYRQVLEVNQEGPTEWKHSPK